MLMKDVTNYHFKNSLQAVNIVQKFRLPDEDGSVSVNPNLLFQSLTANLLSGKNNDNQVKLSIFFPYSLSRYPALLTYYLSEMLIPARSKVLEPFKEICSFNNGCAINWCCY